MITRRMIYDEVRKLRTDVIALIKALGVTPETEVTTLTTRNEVRELKLAINELISKEDVTMGRLDEMNEKIAAFKASQDAENAAIEQVKAAIEALKNAPVGDPDAVAAADAALAAWDDAKGTNDAQAADLASAAVQALHSKGM